LRSLPLLPLPAIYAIADHVSLLKPHISKDYIYKELQFGGFCKCTRHHTTNRGIMAVGILNVPQ
jgi:hypothetical protein